MFWLKSKDSQVFNRCRVAEDRNERLEQEMQVLINRCKKLGDVAKYIEIELKSREDMPNVKLER
jgi:hypothetical protein